MATISVSLPSDGETIDASDYNTPINTIVNEINGNLDNANLDANAAIAGSKLADGGITTTKIDDGAVTPDKRSGGFYATLWDASALGTGTGKTITGIGFTPKALIIVGNGQVSTGGIVTSAGYCYYTGSVYVQGFQSGGSTGGSLRTINSTTQAFGSTTQTATQFVGAVTGFSSDTITVNITTNGGNDYAKFHIIVLG